LLRLFADGLVSNPVSIRPRIGKSSRSSGRRQGTSAADTPRHRCLADPAGWHHPRPEKRFLDLDLNQE
jgi:hypothetical protein